MKLAIRAAAGIAAAGVAAAASPPPAPPDGASPQVAAGAALFQQHCALCHGADGRGAAPFPRPIWGAGTDIGKFTDAKGLYEYVQMLMPFDDPAKVDAQGKAAIVAYMLVRNGSMKAGDSLPPGGNATPLR